MYSFLNIVFSLLFTIVFRWKIYGRDHIPQEGGAIIAANHISLWDPPFIGAALPRHIHFMAKAELFEIPILNKIFKTLHVFPVRRGLADRVAIRTAIERLAAGHLVGIFPEGTRSKTGELGTPALGVAMIAVKAGVPIIPVAIIGTNLVFSRNQFLPQFQIRFGNPIAVEKGKSDKDTLDSLTYTIMQAISQLKKEG